MAKIDVKIDGTYFTQRCDGTVVQGVVPNARAFVQTKPDPVRSQKPKGILPPKPYSFTEQRSWPGYYSYDFPNCGRRYGESPGEVPGFPVPLSRLTNSALIKALAKLKGQKVNFGVAFAEAQTTANMVGSAARTIRNSINALRRRDPAGFARAMGANRDLQVKQAIPARWLELQYGWKPLMSDVKGAFDELTSSEPWSWVTTVRAEATEEQVESFSRAFPLSSMKETRSHRAAVSLSYWPKQYALQSAARTGLLNPAEIVWEKVPFSFVVDWFLPVGDYLTTLDATVGFEFLHGSSTYFTRARRETIPQWAPSQLGQLKQFKPATGESVKLTRGTYATSPLPRAPSFKSPLSLGHMANGLSLLAQLFNRGK